jgi:N-acetylglucosaminyldiphosphoundecaprenol N-acetyl-beta-D-mannosaminyltransferase
MKRQRLISIDITLGPYREFIHKIIQLAAKKQSAYVCVANVHMLIEAYRNEKYANVVNTADMVTPDGMPLAKAMSLLYNIKQERVAGMDLLPDLLTEAETNNLSVFFYGGKQVTLDKTHEYLKRVYPKLNVAGLFSPPFRPLTDLEIKDVISRINQSAANLVFVALGCPKQENWMHQIRGEINAVSLGIGGALPVMVGLQNRAPRWLQKLSLEWVYRLWQEPKRLFKRYVTTNSLFIYILFKEWFNIKVLNKLT